MKPILYSENEKLFDTNGIGILSDATDCSVDWEINGTYELELQYPVAGIHFENISQRAIILSKVDPVSKMQPFRIYRITKPSNGKVTVYARHVAYDHMGISVSPFVAANAAAALQGIKQNAVGDCPFTYWTDIDAQAAMQLSVPMLAWNILGGTEGGILDTYGGEYEFDRWEVKLHRRRGADRGVSIRYGKNLTTLEQDENIANCFTGIYPYWSDTEGNLVQLPEKVVHASGTFSYERTKPVDFSSEWSERPTEEQLRSRAEKYIKDNDIGKPKVSWKVEFYPLEQTEEYKDIAAIEQVLPGDTVTVTFPMLNVDTTARAVAGRYKPLEERYAYITLGSVKTNIASTIAQQGKDIEKKPSLGLMQTVSEQLAAAIMGAKGGAVRLLDTDGDGKPDELYIADNADPNKARKVWRFNYEGWAASKNGYSGPFAMGATLEDGLLASFVTAAHLVAGTIRSKDGKSVVIDLDNGLVDVTGNIKTQKEEKDGGIRWSEIYPGGLHAEGKWGSINYDAELKSDGLTIQGKEGDIVLQLMPNSSGINPGSQIQLNDFSTDAFSSFIGSANGQEASLLMSFGNNLLRAFANSERSAITGLTSPVDSSDAVNKGYVDGNFVLSSNFNMAVFAGSGTPLDAIKASWGSFNAEGITAAHFYVGGGVWNAIISKYGANLGSVILFGYGATRPTYYTLIGGVWTEQGSL